MLHFTPPRHPRDRLSPPGFIQPALLTLATKVPTGPGWIHELKHDGIRLIARKDGPRVCLWSRHGRNRTGDFAVIADALRSLPVDGAVLDGEAVAHCEAGLPDFPRTLSSVGQREACLLAFDLLAIDGEDLRTLPLLTRRARPTPFSREQAGVALQRAHGWR
jgi:bifunctional non-homologous end joining protein LigD